MIAVRLISVLVLSLAAYVTSSHMRIEERFNNAVGIHADLDEEDLTGDNFITCVELVASFKNETLNEHLAKKKARL